jgi:hypothetical protein
MPITPLQSNADPFALLASMTSNVVLSLEKLRQNEGFDREDGAALSRISARYDSLSEANELRVNPDRPVSFESLSADVRTGFFTLVTIQSSSNRPRELPDFGTMASHIRSILIRYESGIPPATDEIEKAQLACLDFLEQLNESRPAFPQP